MAQIFSMTGYGKAQCSLPGKKLSIEVKSLNSKQLDINVRCPQIFREREAELRKMVSQFAQRGKLDLSLYCEVTGEDKAPRLNTALLKSYLGQLRDVAREMETEGDLLAAVMRLPEVSQATEDEMDDAQWKMVREALGEALDQLQQFRADEGESLREDLRQRVATIGQKLEAVAPHEEDRLEKLRERLRKGLAELAEKIDENRYEQELIYYLEKLDVTEEKVRLKAHLNYFLQLLDQGGAIGKKLGFISQEMGREINTLGSKANHASIQKLVVEMKDELEKIKEQVLNLL